MEPAPKELAEKRALICSACPHNLRGTLASVFIPPEIETIRRQLAIKTDMGLVTSCDLKLGICKMFRMPMKLRVHAPIEHIWKLLAPGTAETADVNCWVKAKE